MNGLLKKKLGRHFWNQIKRIKDYSEIPKMFRDIINYSAYNHYSSMGKFYLITTSDNKYVVMSHDNDNEYSIKIVDSNAKDFSPIDVESDLKILYFGIGLKELLRYYENTQGKSEKITESEIFINKKNNMKKTVRLTEDDLARIVNKVISENEDNTSDFIKDIKRVLNQGLSSTTVGKKGWEHRVVKKPLHILISDIEDVISQYK
jgi:hypothetical protein